MANKKYNQVKLHFTEKKLIELIRELGAGEITVKTQDGLPMVVVIHDKKKVVLNQETDSE